MAAPGLAACRSHSSQTLMYVDAEWRQTANSRRAKYYRLTRAGKKQLEEETSNWSRRASAVARILKAEG